MTGIRRVKKPTLSVRRKKFVKNYVAGMGVGDAALRAGYAHRTEGSALFREPAVLTALQAALEKAGIDDPYVAKKLKEGLEATYPELRSKDGAVLKPTAPDFFTRGQYLDKAFKVRGDYAPERRVEEKKVLTINVNMETLRGLKDCGVIEAEVLTRLDGEDDGEDRREPEQPDQAGGYLTEGNRTGEGQEDRGVRQAVGEEAERLGGTDISGEVPEDAQCGEGPGEAASD